MSDVAPSALTDAILANDVAGVADLLDQKTPVGETELMALIKLAWEHRGAKEDPELVEAADDARQIYTMIAEAPGANIQLQTNRGRIVDRIAAVQQDWPSAADLATHGPQMSHMEAATPGLVGATTEAPPTRAARGAMHRRPR